MWKNGSKTDMHHIKILRLMLHIFIIHQGIGVVVMHVMNDEHTVSQSVESFRETLKEKVNGTSRVWGQFVAFT